MSSHERLSYLQSIEDRYSNSFSLSVNPCVNLQDAFNEIDCVGTDHLKVYLRVRPVVNGEDREHSDHNIKILDDRNVSLIAPAGSHAHKNKPHGIAKLTRDFTFTHVYGPKTSQKVIFEDTTECLVNEVLCGQNCLLFTYGATNSGKTHTVQGTQEDPGLLPRTLMLLFNSIGNQHYTKNDLKPQFFCGVARIPEKEIAKEEEIKERLLKQHDFTVSSLSSSCLSLQSYRSHDSLTSTLSEATSVKELGLTQSLGEEHGCYYAVFVSLAEIYNEYIYDMLEKPCKKVKPNPLVLGEDKHGSIYIKGLKYIRVNSVEEALQIADIGRRNLHFASTNLNHHSSRSHSIFSIKIIRLADLENAHVAQVSMLSLCDLAGAERAAKTHNSQDRLKEASNINTSLLVLGRCIAALRQNQLIEKQSSGSKRLLPVPYRESKVTRLFQSFFLGKGSLSMIVNMSTSSLMFDETLKVLKFSAIAGKVAIVQEKLPMDQPVQADKAKSQFSRFMRQSYNMSQNSGRLSVPWQCNDTTQNITFGNDASKLETLNETQEIDDKLVNLVQELRDRLLKEIKEKQELEVNLRKEICDAFSQRIVEIENSCRDQIAEERSRNEELMEWRLNHALEGTTPHSSRKRQRLEEDQDPILAARDELKASRFEEEVALLKEELEVIKATLKNTNQSLKGTQEENSKLKFQLAKLTSSLDEAIQAKEALEKSLSAHKESGDQTSRDNFIIAELEKNLSSTKEQLDERNEENKDLREMLQEAALEFIEKDTAVTNLTSKLQDQQSHSTKQVMTINELESQLSEAREMVGSQGVLLEDRETQIARLNAQIAILKGQQNDGESAVPTTPTSSEKSLHLREKNKLLLEIVQLKQELQYALKPHTSLDDPQTNKLQEQLQDSMQQNVHMQETIKKLEGTIQELEDHRRSQTDKSVLSLQQKCSTLESCLQKLHISTSEEDLDTKVEEYLQEKTKMECIVQQAEEEKEDVTFQLQEKATELLQLKEERASLESETESRIHKLTQEKALMEAKIQRLTTSISELEVQSSHQLQQNRELEESLSKLGTLKQELEAEQSLTQEYMKRIQKFQTEKEESDSILMSLREELNVLKMDLKQATEDNESLQNKCEKLKASETCRLDALQSSLDSMKEQNEGLQQTVHQLQQEKTQLLANKDLADQMKAKYHDIQHENINLQKTNLDLESRHKQNQERIMQLELALAEKEEVVNKISSKVQKLDKDLNLREEELAASKSRAEILIKEATAIREARRQEVNKHHMTLEEKDREILSLQSELKNSLQFSCSDVKSSTRMDIKEDMDDSRVRTLEEHLSAAETDKELLQARIAVLEQQVSQQKSVESSLRKQIVGHRDPSVASNDTDGDMFATPHTEKRNTRSSRRKPTQNVSSSTGEPTSRATRSSRKNTKSVHEEAATGSDGEDTDEFEPPTTKKATRSTRGRPKKSTKISNPHIENRKSEPAEKENVPANTRSTRRRPLFNLNADETYECEPDLLPADLGQDSPHTVVRRKLRRKGK